MLSPLYVLVLMMGIFSVEKSAGNVLRAGELRFGLERGDSIGCLLLVGLRGDCISDSANFGSESSHGLVIDIHARDFSIPVIVNKIPNSVTSATPA